MPTGWLLIIGWFVLAIIAAVLAFRISGSDRIQKRLFAPGPGEEPLPTTNDDRGWLGGWLYLAGFRSPIAAPVFIVANLILLSLGFLAAYLMQRSGMVTEVLKLLDAVPGGSLDIAAPLVYGAPWLVILVIVSLPWLVVRSVRRERVAAIEQDLPVMLELLSTLAEAGLSFDPALDRVLESQPPGRLLTRELRAFRAETLAGRARIQSFRRLARRTDVSSLSTFVSALVQAEQSGAGIAVVLRQQADDLRNRRREKALEAATALPVKRLIPLFVCFMPGLFVWALGPSFYTLFRFVDVFTKNRGMR